MKTKTDFESYRESHSPRIEQEMYRLFSKLMPAEYPEQRNILAYHFGWDRPESAPIRKGKKLRPLFLLLSAESVGGDWRSAMPAAVAVEFIHNFSLIHDDIEDHDEFRHGREAVWKKWGSEKAINAGDALFSLAFACLGSSSVDEGRARECVLILSNTCLRLTGGQSMDIAFEKDPQVRLDDYLLMIEGKTAALFSGCCKIGAVLGGGSRVQQKLMGEIGLQIGMAFQMRDDWLGLWGSSRATGKMVGNDLLTGKRTLPILYAMEKSTKVRGLLSKSVREKEIPELIQRIADCGAKEYTQHYQAQVLERAERGIRKIEKTDERVTNIFLSLLDDLRHLES